MLRRLAEALVRDWEGEPSRPVPYDRIVMHGGDNRQVMVAAVLVLLIAVMSVAWLLVGVLWGVLALLAVSTACIVGIESTGGVRR